MLENKALICMSEKEIDDRLSNGESASRITIIQWTRAKSIVEQFELPTFRKFINFIYKYDIDFVCPMCEVSDTCDDCVIMRESGKHCFEKGSLYKNIKNARTQSGLIESINTLIEFLGRFDKRYEIA